MEEKHTTWQAAQDVYRKAILLFPKDSQMLVEYGKMLAKKGGEDAIIYLYICIYIYINVYMYIYILYMYYISEDALLYYYAAVWD